MASDISDVKVFPMKNKHPRIRANCSFVVAGRFRVKCTVAESPKGLYVGFPGRYSEKLDPETGKKIWYDDVCPVSKDAREEITSIIMTAYKKLNDKSETPTNRDNIPFG